jgi:hypothetical protein
VRKALNENPIVQVALIGILVIAVGVLFMTRMSSGGGEAPPPATTTPATAAPTPAPAPEASAGADSASPSASADAPAPSAPADPAAAAPAPDGAPVDESGFVAGPGLPGPVVAAYDSGETVVILVVRENGIDDRKVEETVRAVSADQSTTLFVTPAVGIAKYSRITQGVDVDRVPAMVVIRPKRLSEGPLPEATVSYGFRGPESVAQTVRDANYKGRDDLPSYPE